MAKKIFTVSNFKGGVGKSTTVANVGYVASLAGWKTLIIDTDEQNQIASNFGVDREQGLDRVLMGDMTPAEATKEARENLFIIPAGQKVPRGKKELAADLQPNTFMTRALSEYAKGFDLVLIDTQPGFDQLVISCMVFTKAILAPVTSDAKAAESLVGFVNRVRELAAIYPEVHIARVIPTMHDKRYKITSEMLGELKSSFADKLTTPALTDGAFKSAHRHGQCVCEYAPKGNGAKSYIDITKEILAS